MSIHSIDLTKAFDMVNHTKLFCALTLSYLSNNKKRWLSALLERANSQLPIQLFSLAIFSCQGNAPSGCMYIPYPIQLLCLHIPPIWRLSHQLPYWWLHRFLFQLQRWSGDWGSFYPMPIHQVLRSGQMSGAWPFLLQNPPSIYSPLNSHNLTPILKSLWTTPYYPWKGIPVYWM